MMAERTHTQDQPLEAMLSFQLIRLCHKHRSYSAERLTSLGLHTGQNIILHYLYQQDGLTQSELAERLEVQQPTAAKMLKRMEEAGFVRREPYPGDARASLIRLTEQGRALQEPLEAFWHGMETQIMKELSFEEQVLFKRLLKQVIHNLS